MYSRVRHANSDWAAHVVSSTQPKRNIVSRRTTFTLSMITLLCLGVAVPGSAIAAEVRVTLKLDPQAPASPCRAFPTIFCMLDYFDHAECNTLWSWPVVRWRDRSGLVGACHDRAEIEV